MIIGIILALLTTVGYFLSKNDDYEFSGGTLGISCGFLLALHLMISLMTMSDYDVFVEKRNVFLGTVKNQKVTSYVLQETNEYNQDLMWKQRQNSFWFIGQYVDDRFDSLEPIVLEDSQ